MANKTVTVASAGGDYTSLNAALSGESANLTSATYYLGGPGILNIQCNNFQDTTVATTGTGYTTSSSYYINIYGNSSDRATSPGKWSTSRYRLVASTPDAEGVLRNYEAYTRVTWIQVHNTWSTTGDYNPACIYGEAASAQFGYLVVRGTAEGGDYPKPGILLAASCVAYNCVVYDVRNTSTSEGTGIERRAWTGGAKAYNCTVQNCHYGFITHDDGQSAANQLVLINCLTSGCSDGYFAEWQWGTGTNYNASDLAADAPGANSRNSQTFSFVDAANDDFHLTLSDAGARDYGTSDPGSGLYADDIDGETRSGSWDIGADEYVAAAGRTTKNTRSHPLGLAASVGRLAGAWR